jgi:hypothetical protein
VNEPFREFLCEHGFFAACEFPFRIGQQCGSQSRQVESLPGLEHGVKQDREQQGLAAPDVFHDRFERPIDAGNRVQHVDVPLAAPRHQAIRRSKDWTKAVTAA